MQRPFCIAQAGERLGKHQPHRFQDVTRPLCCVSYILKSLRNRKALSLAFPIFPASRSFMCSTMWFSRLLQPHFHVQCHAGHTYKKSAPQSSSQLYFSIFDCGDLLCLVL